MAKHKKFVFQELPKLAVANFYRSQTGPSSGEEELINTVITQHFSNIVNKEEGENDAAGSLSEELEKKDENKAEAVDIEQIKLDSYNKGLDASKAEYEEIIDGLKADNNLAEMLQEKLSEICQISDINVQAARLSASLLSDLLKKICLILPIDFEQLLRTQLLKTIQEFYNEGKIKLIIHPTRTHICNNILHANDLPPKLKDHLQIVEDSNIDKNSCRLEWNDSHFDYNQSQLIKEIQDILEQLQNIIE